MESNDAPYSPRHTRSSRRASLHIDPTVSTDSSPDSPPTPASAPPRPTESSPRATPASGPQRSKAAGASGSRSSALPDQAKRKRSRVTPDQLTHLERIFAQDRSPTAAKRKEISELLGMQERQTQIWFQNRRAKAKNQDGKGKIAGRNSPGDNSPPHTPPEGQRPFDSDLLSLLHEDAPVTVIPCTDLAVGSWRRIASSGCYDLVAYTCEAKRCFTWFIQSAGFGFKIEVPFTSVSRVELSQNHQQGIAHIHVTETPRFFLESVVQTFNSSGNVRIWQTCQDWTEGQQASKVFRHTLVGSIVPLTDAMRYLSPGIIVRVPYRPFAMPTVQLPAPPPMQGSVPFPDSGGAVEPAPRPIHHRKRSLSGPASSSQSLSDFAPSFNIPYMQPTGRPSSLQFAPYTQNIFYQQQSHPSTPHAASPPSSDYQSNSLGQRPFLPHLQSSAASLPPLNLYNPVEQQQPDMRRFSSGSSVQSFGGSVSPPLLTQPFTPSMPPTPLSATHPSIGDHDPSSIMGIDLGRSLHEMDIESMGGMGGMGGHYHVTHDASMHPLPLSPVRPPSGGGHIMRPHSTGAHIMRPPSSGDGSSSLEGALGLSPATPPE